MKSFKPKETPEGGERANGRRTKRACRLQGQKRSNETHRSTTDPNSMLYRRRPHE